MLEGKALLISLIVIAIVSTMMHTSIESYNTYIGQNSRQSENAHRRELIDAAISLAVHSEGLESSENGSVEYVKGLSSAFDSTILSKSSWGLYDEILGKAYSLNRLDTFQKSYLLGREYTERPVLHIQDRGVSPALTGTASIIGDVEVPKGRIGTYNGDGLKPEISENHIGELSASKIYLPNCTDRARRILACSPERLVDEHFTRGNLQIESDVNSEGGLRMKPRDVFYSRNTVVIDQEGVFNTVIVAPEVIVRAPASGVIQVYASKSIIIEEGVSLEEGTVLVSGESGMVSLEEGSIIKGDIVALNEKSTAPSIVIPRNSNIKGVVYNKGITLLDGSITGSLTTGQVVGSFNGRIFANIIVSGSLTEFSSPQTSSFIFKEEGSFSCGIRTDIK